MKKLFFTITLLSTGLMYSQVGINNTTPKATLDITGTPTNTSIADGVIFPKLTGNELKAKDAAYNSNHTGAIVYVTTAASPTSTKTANITKAGFYYYDGSVWQFTNNINANTVENGLSVNSNKIELGGEIKKPTAIWGVTNTNKFSITGSGTSSINIDGSTFSVDADNNRVGVNMTNPSTTLDVNGDVRVRNLTAGAAADNVLVVDTNGVLKSTYNVARTFNVVTDPIAPNATVSIDIDSPVPRICKILVISYDGCVIGDLLSVYYKSNNSIMYINSRSYNIQGVWTQTDRTSGTLRFSGLTFCNDGTGGDTTRFDYDISLANDNRINITNRGNVVRRYTVHVLTNL